LFCLVRALLTTYDFNFLESLSRFLQNVYFPGHSLIEHLKIELMIFKFTSTHHIGFEAAL
jgi:hypothetical protein